MSPSLLLSLPFPEQRLQILRSIRAKLSHLTRIPTVEPLLRDLDEDINDLEKLIRKSNPKVTNRPGVKAKSRRISRSQSPQSPHLSPVQRSSSNTALATRRSRSQRPTEETTRYMMSGALPPGAQPPEQKNPLLVRNKTSIEGFRQQEEGNWLLVASHHKDEEPKLGQIWRRGPRAFINDIIRREIGRRLQEGEQVRVLDKETAAFLDKELKKASLQTNAEELEDRGRRSSRHETTRQLESTRERRRVVNSPISRTESTASASASHIGHQSETQSTAASTNMAMVRGHTSADAITHTRGSNSKSSRQPAARPYDAPPSTPALRGSRAFLSPTHDMAIDTRRRRPRSQRDPTTDGVRSTVASTWNLANWTEADDSVITVTTEADEEDTEGQRQEERARQMKKVRARLSESERRRFYQLGRDHEGWKRK